MNMTTIQIGNITIDDVEVLPSGVVRKIGRRARFRDTSAQEDVMSLRNRSLRHLVMIVYNIKHSGYRIDQIDQFTLLEYCQRFLRCSERTAYDYAKAIGWVGALLGS